MIRIDRRTIYFALVITLVAIAYVFLADPTLASDGEGNTYIPNVQSHNGTGPTPKPTVQPTATTPQPTATTDPGGNSVRILPRWTQYEDSLGHVHIIGEVENATSERIQFVKVTANLYDGSNALVGTPSMFTSLKILAPGETTCFDFRLTEPPKFTSLDFEEPSYLPATDSRPALTILDHNGSVNSIFGWYDVIGHIRNDETVSLKFVKLVATFYDKDMAPLDCDLTYIDEDVLNPGATSEFEMYAPGSVASNITSYKLQTDGRPE